MVFHLFVFESVLNVPSTVAEPGRKAPQGAAVPHLGLSSPSSDCREYLTEQSRSPAGTSKVPGPTFYLPHSLSQFPGQG